MQNTQNGIFETCNNNQTEIEPKTNTVDFSDDNQTTLNDIENHDDNQIIKTGRGGYRENSGRKSSGIEAVTVRIDKRLLNLIAQIKDDFKNGKSLDDIISKPTAKNDDAKLFEKIAELELERDNFRMLYIERRESSRAEIARLKDEIASLARNKTSTGNIDDKLRKRLIQALHPDKFQDVKQKAVNGKLVKELNAL